MASEYGLELLDKVQRDFAKYYANDSKIKNLTKKIANNSQSYEDANEYAIRVGELASKALTNHVNSNDLNYISRELAEDVLKPTLTTDYELISNAIGVIQANKNMASNISLQPQIADLDTNRIDGLINKIASYETLDQGEYLLKEPIVNYSQAVVDDSIRKNAKVQAKAGLTPKIRRVAESGACRWCRGLEGVYEPQDAPDNIYRRHEFCRCQVTYENGKERQDVWSKTKWEVEEEQAQIKKLEKAIEEKEKELQAELSKNEYKKQFIEATTYEQAKKFADDVLGVQYVNIDKVDISVLNKVNEDIAKIYDVFGNLSIGNDNVLNYINGYTGKARFVAAYTPNSGAVQIRPNKLKTKNSLQKLKKEAEEAYKMGFWSSDGVDHSFLHELGHGVEKKYYTNGTNEVKNEISKLRKKVIKDIGLKKWVNVATEENLQYMAEASKYLSYYALKDNSEFVAEAVASYMSDTPKPLAEEVVNILLNGG